jgi:hypothetical protein
MSTTRNRQRQEKTTKETRIETDQNLGQKQKKNK